MVFQVADLQMGQKEVGNVGCLLFMFDWDELEDVFPLKALVFNVVGRKCESEGFVQGQVSICFVEGKLVVA